MIRMSSVTGMRQERLHLRLSAHDDGLIRAAAAAARMSITEFVVRAARSSAADTLADRDHVVLDAAAWDELERRVNEPGRRSHAVAELFARPDPFSE